MKKSTTAPGSFPFNVKVNFVRVYEGGADRFLFKGRVFARCPRGAVAQAVERIALKLPEGAELVHVRGTAKAARLSSIVQRPRVPSPLGEALKCS